MNIVVIFTLMAAMLFANWLGLRQGRDHEKRNSAREIESLAATHRLQLAIANSQAAAAKDVAEQWKTIAGKWIVGYEKMSAQNEELLLKLSERVFPAPRNDDGDGDPPSVTESDRLAVEEKRAEAARQRRARPLDHGFTPVVTHDDEIQPVHRAADGYEDDEA